MKNLFLLLPMTLFLFGCTLIDNLNKCGPSFMIGQYYFSDQTKAFLPYDGTETLTFTDQDGAVHRLICRDGRQNIKTRNTVRILCYEAIFDQSEIYFETERDQVAFWDTLGRPVIVAELYTTTKNHPDLDSIVVYDYLYVSASNPGAGPVGHNKIFIKNRRNTLSTADSLSLFGQTWFIGDTVIYGRAFSSVYKGTFEPDHNLYFSTTQGVVALQLSDTKYWVLRN